MLQQLDQVRAERQDIKHELQVARKAAERYDSVIGTAEVVAALWDSLDHRPGFFDETTGDPVEPTDEEWRELITSVADKVWVEPDSTLTLEGPLSAMSRNSTYSSSF